MIIKALLVFALVASVVVIFKSKDTEARALSYVTAFGALVALIIVSV